MGGALERGDPVVALETTILTHGMPHPHNLETALAVEGVVRGVGAIPAHIGLLDGKVHVGQQHSMCLCAYDYNNNDVIISRKRVLLLLPLSIFMHRIDSCELSYLQAHRVMSESELPCLVTIPP